MVNRFTPKAQASLSTAKRCAEKMGHSYIGSEHLILGILSCDSAGKKLLEDKKILYADFYEKLAEIAGLGTDSPAKIRELTPKCKKIIEACAAVAKRFGAPMIGTEHILYAICDDEESVGARILSTLGLNLNALKNEITSLLDSAEQIQRSERHTIPGAPTLSLYGKSLNARARQGKCDPLIGREEEILRLARVLCRRTKNNPCLIGEPGVGKTAIVEGLAQKINQGSVPAQLINKTIVSLDLSSLIAGAKYRGEFEERLRNVLNELKGNDSLILFIDEIHSIIGAGAAEGAIDAANIIKPALARAEIQLIGATTHEEYRRHIEKDAALERRFQPITVNEPTESETIDILMGIKENYESFHGVFIPKQVIDYAVRMSNRYINDRFLPDKAIDLIDEACSEVKMSLAEGTDGDNALSSIIRDKENAILQHNFELARELAQKEQRLKKTVDIREQISKKPSLTKHSIDNVITQWTSIPVGKVNDEGSPSYASLEQKLSERIIGQNEAILAVAASIKRGLAGFKSHKKPTGAFLFAGPTGVGKTELAKAISESIFGSAKSLIRLDMSEFAEKHSISKLIGSPPGYVGYDEGGILTKSVKAHPYSVVLFDEIEKAHPDIYSLLLQILDESMLTDSMGRQVSFKNTVIILTSNIGADYTSRSTLGFSQSSAQENDTASHMWKKLKSYFPPEFLNRLDEIIAFKPLELSDTEKIVSLMLKEVVELSQEIGIFLSFDPQISSCIAKKHHSREYGARPLKRAIMSLIETPLSEKILLGEIKKGDSVSVFCQNDNIEFKVFSLA